MLTTGQTEMMNQLRADRSAALYSPLTKKKVSCNPLTAEAGARTGRNPDFCFEAERVFSEVPEPDRRAAYTVYLRRQVRAAHDAEGICKPEDHELCDALESCIDFGAIAEMMLASAALAVAQQMKAKSDA